MHCAVLPDEASLGMWNTTTQTIPFRQKSGKKGQHIQAAAQGISPYCSKALIRFAGNVHAAFSQPQGPKVDVQLWIATTLRPTLVPGLEEVGWKAFNQHAFSTIDAPGVEP
eukprot:scaffold100537_cov32-Tisochrysis_lutea.AAC.2